jgi:hypothetical protein
MTLSLSGVLQVLGKRDKKRVEFFHYDLQIHAKQIASSVKDL